MKKRLVSYLLLFLMTQGMIAGCLQNEKMHGQGNKVQISTGNRTKTNSTKITPSMKMEKLEEDLFLIGFEGNDGFDQFLKLGGAESDRGVVEYLMNQLSFNGLNLFFGGNPFGCSTLSAAGSNGGYLFGRNFDWSHCKALIIYSKPEQGYRSVSTVNMDFIQAGGIDISKLPDKVQAIIGLYAPLDGMNEKGLAVSVNMIQDSDTIEQNTEKPDITTTTAIRLLLNEAANVDEAIRLLQQYDFHASMGMMIHLALADAEGNSVVVEYINHEMVVTNTPVVTNFYLTEGKKYKVGTKQSHDRYEILTNALREQGTMTEEGVKDALRRVSKGNFGEFESTEWSIVMNQETKEVTYFHRENYETGYKISIE